jgi:hypothetical protein
MSWSKHSIVWKKNIKSAGKRGRIERRSPLTQTAQSQWRLDRVGAQNRKWWQTMALAKLMV